MNRGDGEAFSYYTLTNNKYWKNRRLRKSPVDGKVNEWKIVGEQETPHKPLTNYKGKNDNYTVR